MNIQDKSWFREKTKETILQDITNFINNSILNNDKNDINGTAINLNNLKSLMNETNLKKLSSQANINYIDKKNTDNKSKNYLSSNWMPKERKSINLLKNSVLTNLNPNYIPQLIMKKRSNANFNSNHIININSSKQSIKNSNSNSIKIKRNSILTNNTTSKLNLTSNIKDKPKITSKFNVIQKPTNRVFTDQESLELTMEEEMINLNNLKNDINEKIRKKIKTSVKRDKILKLTKEQNELINSLQEEINNSFQDVEYNSQLINNFKKIKELNKNLNINLKEFLETDCKTEEENQKKKPINDKSKLTIDKTINFNIEASYYNLNNLTKGKVIKSEKYKEEIKYLIEKFIKTKKEYSLNLINEFIKLYTKKSFSEQDNALKKNLTKNENNQIPHIDNISVVFNKIINKKTKKNKKQTMPNFPKHAKTKKNSIITPKFVSNKIKNTKTNNKDVYMNFKSYNNGGKSSQLKFDNKKVSKQNLKKKTFDIKIDTNQQKEENNEKEDSSNIFAKMINKFLSRLK